jgi:DNA-binding Lrp family transcriptional regulator
MANLIKVYLLIETQVGESNTVLDELKQIKQTVQVDRVTGPYDIICIVETESLDDISDIIQNHIHSLPGVTRTMTCMQLGT